MISNMVAKKVIDISFAGCGFLGMFHVGSLAAFRRYQAEGDIKFKLLFRNSNISIQFRSKIAWEPVLEHLLLVLQQEIWRQIGWTKSLEGQSRGFRN